MSQLPASVNKGFTRFFTALIFLTAILIILAFTVFRYVVPVQIPPIRIYFTFLLLFSVTLLVHYLLLLATTGRPGKFVRRFMLTSALKLFIYLVFVLISTFTDRENAIAFLLLFFILYLAFTTFEVIFLFRQIREDD